MSLFSGETVTYQNTDLGTTSIKGIFTVNAPVTPGSVPAYSSTEITVTINGVKVGDFVDANVPANFETGLIESGCRVTAANTVAIRISNITSASVTGTSRTWVFRIFKLS
jgi:hypothetical protein